MVDAVTVVELRARSGHCTSAAARSAGSAAVATNAGTDWALRWFTPTVEVNLCGHATLATAHVLREDRRVPGTVRFRSRSGVLITRTHDDGTVTLDFPAASTAEVPVPDNLAEALDAQPETTHGTGTLRDLLAVFPEEAAVRALTLDFTALTRLTRRDGIRGVIATAPASDPCSGYEFVSRFFAPRPDKLAAEQGVNASRSGSELVV